MTNQNQKAVHSEYCDTLQGGQTWRCRTPNGAGFEGQRAPCFCQNDPGVEEEGDSKEGKTAPREVVHRQVGSSGQTAKTAAPITASASG